jgi:hypothetical protein
MASNSGFGTRVWNAGDAVFLERGFFGTRMTRMTRILKIAEGNFLVEESNNLKFS